MPTYDYRCEGCGHEMALFQGITEDPIKECPECHKDNLRRLIGSGAGIIFRGSGFYETDYKRSRSSSEGKKPEQKEPPKSDSKPQEKSKSDD